MAASEIEVMREMSALRDPVRGIMPENHPGANDIMRAYETMSFQARELGRAADIFTRMTQDRDTLKVLTLAGALIPGGLGPTISTLVQRRMVDVIVSTGANISHDLVEGMGHHHYRHCGLREDRDLRVAHVNRIYDTYLDEEGFNETAKIVMKHLSRIAGTRTSPEICSFLGDIVKRPCLLSAAKAAGVPIFIPALNDSELGIILTTWNTKHPKNRIVWDALAGNLEFAKHIKDAKKYGILICGGGVPRNWAQQVTPLLECVEVGYGLGARPFPGYSYGVNITTDTPVFGGMSGCTMSESVSWGKYDPDAEMVTVNCDVTIALPLIAAAAIARAEPSEQLSRSG